MMTRNYHNTRRPHLELDEHQQLALFPPRIITSTFFTELRLRKLLVEEFPYWTDSALKEIIDLNRAIFRETAAQSRARGAVPLFVLPIPGAPGDRTLEQHPDAEFIRQLFIDQQLPYLIVDYDGSWIVPTDGHPDARGNDILW